jgi:hypothetical protein
MLVLRFIGVLNAAVWLGAAIFFSFAAGPAFFSAEMKSIPSQLLHPFWPGVMAQQVIERFFYLQQICGVIAVVHLVAEWFYLGRPLQKLNVALLSGLLFIGFAGGFWLQPKLHRLHLVKYGMKDKYQADPRPKEERAAAVESFKSWHRVARVIDLVALAGLLVYFWRVTHPSDDLRVLNAGATPQFRS